VYLQVLVITFRNVTPFAFYFYAFVGRL